jgi:ATP-dependent helicase/nuclease subunit B
MAITRKLLDWKGPALAAAAEFLCARYAAAGGLDLRQAILVLPGSRAGRRLLEILVTRSEELGLALAPPTILTASTLPEQLYQLQRPFASTLTQQLAWATALRKLPRERLRPFLPHPPESGDALRWLALGDMLRRLHEELAEDALDFRQVLEKAKSINGFSEHDRWRALAEVQRAYHDTLDGFQLWDKQTARLVAIQKREIRTDKDIVLIGMVDLNTAQRQMLDQVANRVTALVFAPPELADRFDEHGCLIPSAWTAAELQLDDRQVERVDGPADQAAAITAWLASLGGKYRADEIVVGLPDEKLAPQIERELTQSGVHSRYVEAKRLKETGPYRLLQVAADYAVRGRFRDLAALVRHPDVYEWLLTNLPSPLAGEGPGVRGQKRHDILTALDIFAAERLPARIDAERLEKDQDLAEVRAIYAAIDVLLRPLAQPAQPLAGWVRPFRELLVKIYGHRELDRNQPNDRYLVEALEWTTAALATLAEVPADLQPAVDAREAVRVVLDALSGKSIPPPAEPNAVELLGWLELPLDDAPALVVTTFNDGFVPAATSGDVFLPNCLREALGLEDNDRRLARDAYALSVLAASRKELKLIVGHRDAEGNPLVPSRLLFAADTDTVVRRSLKFFADPPAAAPRRNLLMPLSGPQRESLLHPPRPTPREPLPHLSVTKFRDYIACPYRFYLRHVLKLEAIADDSAELDGAAFGNLVHHVLEQFGRADEARDARNAADPERIIEYLDFKLTQMTAARYGKYPRAAVAVQIEQLRLRLAAFAAWQAERTRAGWRIVYSEDSADRKGQLEADFAVDGEDFTLLGRIDRIDYHDDLKKLSVLDYKTADAGLPPQKTHRRKDEWIDLQLPLYRHLIASAKLPVPCPPAEAIELGYIVLPKSTAAAGLATADWQLPDLEAADERARDVIRGIRAQVFWPPTSPPPDFADDVAAICQDNRLGRFRQPTEGDAA